MQQFGIRSILSLLLVGLIVLSSPVSSRPLLVAYYADTSLYRSCYNNLYKFTPEKLNSIISAIDVINFSFAKLDGSGHIIMIEGKDCVLGKWVGCKAASSSVALIDRVLKLKSINPSLRVLLSIGGKTWAGVNTCPVFSQMANTGASRQTFINEGIQISRKLGFSGIDLVWEYPAAEERDCHSYDTENFRLLLSGFRDAIEAEVRPAGVPKLLLSIAAPSRAYAPGLNISNVHQYVDWINVMTFDYSELLSVTDHNAPYSPQWGSHRDSVSGTVYYYDSIGVPRSKIVVGMPAFGRGYQVNVPYGACPGLGSPITGHSPPEPCTNEAGMYAYYEVLSMLRNMSTTFDIRTHSVSACNADASAWLTYDDHTTLHGKTGLASYMGGAMVWTVDMDDFPSGFPLITTIRKTLDDAANGGLKVCKTNITLHQIDGVNPWWFGFKVLYASQQIAKVSIMDQVSRVQTNPMYKWMPMTKTDWGPWVIDMTSRELVPPLSVQIISAPLPFSQIELVDVIKSIEPNTNVRTGTCFYDFFYWNYYVSWCRYHIFLKLGDDASEWWFALYVSGIFKAKQVKIRDSSPNAPWVRLTLADPDWATEDGPWIFSDQPEPLQLPLTVDIIAYSGVHQIIPNAITSFTPNVLIDTKYCFQPVYY